MRRLCGFLFEWRHACSFVGSRRSAFSKGFPLRPCAVAAKTYSSGAIYRLLKTRRKAVVSTGNAILLKIYRINSRGLSSQSLCRPTYCIQDWAACQASAIPLGVSATAVPTPQITRISRCIIHILPGFHTRYPPAAFHSAAPADIHPLRDPYSRHSALAHHARSAAGGTIVFFVHIAAIPAAQTANPAQCRLSSSSPVPKARP